MSLRWIDTHNHLFVFKEKEQVELVSQAKEKGYAGALICAGGVENFESARQCAIRTGLSYAVGLHPMYLRDRWQEDLKELEVFLEKHAEDPYLAAIGECGLDSSEAYRSSLAIQERVLSEQMKMSKRYGLPLSLHGRQAMDLLLKYMRRLAPLKGVVHAFNGSHNQAQRFMDFGFKLGFGGAASYDGSKRIRKTLAELPEDAWVLETDCPDIPPDWRRDANKDNPMSLPVDLAAYGQIAAELRGISEEAACDQALKNSLEVFPRLLINDLP